MKTILKIAIVFGLLFVITDSYAQMKIGPKLGVNISTMTFSTSGVSIDPKPLTGFSFGVLFENSASANLSFQTGIMYSGKGSTYKIEGDGVTVDMKIAPWFLQVPYNVLYSFGSTKAKFSLLGGPYLAFGMGGTVEAFGETEKIVFGSDGDLKSMDFGLNIGAGLKIDNFLLSAQYELGLVNMSTTEDLENKLKVFSVSFSYLFGKK
ncbi:MAG: porin family protein [Bacteroidales bacterium]